MQRNTPPELLRALAINPVKVRGQIVELNFRHADLLNITRLNVVVHGFPGTAHVTPTDSTPVKDITESFELVRGEDSKLPTSIQTQTIITVQSVDLTMIEFADGHTWTSPRASACRVMPDDFVLVATAH